MNEAGAPPLIGICGRVLSFADEGRRDAFSSSQPYSRAVAKAGGLPVLLPPLPTAPRQVHTYLDRLGGLLLPGGGDVEPHRYGQQPNTDALYGMVGLHDEFDLALVHAAIERDLPVLAICRGMQVLNVSQGGTLVQDLDSGDERGEGHWMNEHPVDIVAGSKLAQAVGTTHLRHCYSVHHQGLDALGEGIVPVAHDEHGLIEAVEYEGASWIVGVQWHPEDTIGIEAGQLGLFEEFIRRSAAHAAG
ncbi:MAG: gamma-glutamyl-gamma-aminobutyrate hydrolase family protein [Acidimicrobiales bacterium]